MHTPLKYARLCLWLSLFASLCAASARGQGAEAALKGKVVDPLDAVVVGARVTVSGPGPERTAVTDGEGEFTFGGLAPGLYTVLVSAGGFAPNLTEGVKVERGHAAQLRIGLTVEIGAEGVEVKAESGLSTDSDKNASALVLRGSDLESLPDDPDELRAALMALAGPSAGPNGGEIFIDGFSGGRLPPKETISEVRINQNPFSAEFDRMGYGRVEIITKPGSDSRMRGQAAFSFNDESLNARHTFAPTRAPHQSRLYGGNLSGPLVRKHSSFFVDFQRRDIEDNTVVNATVLDAQLRPARLSLSAVAPQQFTTLSPRLDFQLNSRHTFTGRYSYSGWAWENLGVGELSLPSRAYERESTFQSVQLTETAVLTERLLNEARFQYTRSSQRSEGDNSAPTLRVLDSFIGGGAPFGLSSSSESRWELHDASSILLGHHYLRFGGRVRGVHVSDLSSGNFNGTYTFAGGPAPLLDAAGNVVRDAAGVAVLTQITSLERYRRTLLFSAPGCGSAGQYPCLTPADVRERGGGATLFSLVTGEKSARVSRLDVAPFVQDEWNIRSTLMLSLGLRYERQTNISSNYDFAPRFSLAWAPRTGGGSVPTTVVRFGGGVFYDRFSESLTLDALRFNGTNQLQYIIAGGEPGVGGLLDSFPAAPSPAALAAAGLPQTIRRIAPELRTPRTVQYALSVERRMPLKITLTTTLIHLRGSRLLRSLSLDGTTGREFVYDSGGRLVQSQLVLNATKQFASGLSFYSTYALNKASSDTDGPQTFPVDPRDFASEYGPASNDVRHRFFIGGYFRTYLGLRFSPFITASSGRPFNIVTGVDANGDTIFNERPAFAADPAAPGVVATRYGAFDPNPGPGRQLIPRNYGRGPAFFSVNLGLSRSFQFGEMPAGKAKAASGGAKPAPGPLSSFFKNTSEKRFELTLSVQAQNLFNRANLDLPIGNIRSPLFGQSIQTVGAFGFGTGPATGSRRIDAQVRLSF